MYKSLDLDFGAVREVTSTLVCLNRIIMMCELRCDSGALLSTLLNSFTHQELRIFQDTAGRLSVTGGCDSLSFLADACLWRSIPLHKIRETPLTGCWGCLLTHECPGRSLLWS
jgi:hypothetical protein